MHQSSRLEVLSFEFSVHQKLSVPPGTKCVKLHCSWLLTSAAAHFCVNYELAAVFPQSDFDLSTWKLTCCFSKYIFRLVKIDRSAHSRKFPQHHPYAFPVSSNHVYNTAKEYLWKPFTSSMSTSKRRCNKRRCTRRTGWRAVNVNVCPNKYTDTGTATVTVSLSAQSINLRCILNYKIYSN